VHTEVALVIENTVVALGTEEWGCWEKQCLLFEQVMVSVVTEEGVRKLQVLTFV
jgi:hypothetical protein